MDKNWPYMICPACRQNITDPKWRFHALFSISPVPCPHCAELLRLEGNRAAGYGGGAAALLLGGHLWSRGYSFWLCMPLLVGGVGALAWGVFTSRLVPVSQELAR